ncbi:MAG: TlpA family protein disulfide reductase [Acidimicrobiales bacterium]
MRKRVRPRSRPAARAAGGRHRSARLPVFAVMGVVGLAALVAVGVRSTRGTAGEGIYVSDVEIIGSPLPPFESGLGPDPAEGMTVPDARGFGFDSQELLYASGAPRGIVFVAHWCPHCRREISEFTDLLESAEMPEGVEIQTVSTWVEPSSDNYPPDRWLASESWDFPVMNDDESATLGRAFGLTGTPLWIFVDADGTVVERTGALGAEGVLTRLEDLAR